MTILRKPLGEAWKKRVNSRGVLVADIKVDLCELIENDIEGLNDLAEERILGDGAGAILADINYEVIGHRRNILTIRVASVPEEIFGGDEAEEKTCN
jgi:hypothetical protein